MIEGRFKMKLSSGTSYPSLYKRKPKNGYIMQNRQKEEMIRDILTVANGGATITHIMFKAYTSHSQAKSYLSELIEKGLVEYDALDRKYRTSPKGIEYLQVIESMSDILSVKTRRSAGISQVTF